MCQDTHRIRKGSETEIKKISDMGKFQGYRNRLSMFIASDRGQRFFNIAYSLGAAVVIWGALFKILHMKGGDFLLSVGMGTEVLMFILTAFDLPPKSYNWENVFPELDKENGEDAPQHKPVVPDNRRNKPVTAAEPVPVSDVILPDMDTAALAESVTRLSEEMNQLREATARLNSVSETLLASYRAITENSETISGAADGYAEQMQTLAHNIGGLNTIYEIQLKSVSSQIDSIDRVNRGIKDIRDMYEKSASQSIKYCEETEKMTRYMQQLNAVYEKMLTAMTVSMTHPAPDSGKQ